VSRSTSPPAPPAPRRPRVGVLSLGCAKNLVDTEVMLGHLDAAGANLIRDPAEADVIVVNTCSFIDAAREESIRTILEAAELKRTGGARKLVVAGCLVQRYGGELASELPEVDAFVGLDELDRIVEAAGIAAPRPAAPKSDLPILTVRPRPPGRAETPISGLRPSTYLYDAQTPRKRATPAWTAYVKIAEGCDHTCSFCAIPAFRGGFRSRPVSDIVREAESLGRAGVREINLIAQDSSHYGRDRGAREGLATLLERLDGVEGLRWIRVHYLYPNTVTPLLIDAMARLPKVVKYVDLPLQHAHPDTLKRMRRGGSAESHLELLADFRLAMPDVALRSTFIVGFPGETDAEFEALLDFVREARFDHLGVFTYSHEEGTTATEHDDDVPSAVKEWRRARLMELQQLLVAEQNAAWIGRTVEAVVEGPHAETEHLLVARMAAQAPEVDGQILITDGIAPPGRFVQVELTEVAGYDLVGRILGDA
jgi:ribosomal protein S12 methylthiotransferase